MPVVLILEILQAALGGLTALGNSTVSKDAGIAEGFILIIQKAQAAYAAAAGAPLDLTKLPIEAKVP